MKKIVVVGAGKIGSTIAEMLADTGDYHVTVVDRAAAQLDAPNCRQARRRRWNSTSPPPARSKRRWPANSPC